MSNYWNTLSPIHSLLTKRESHATGGKTGKVLKKGRGPHGKTDLELLKEAHPGQFRNESNAPAPKRHTKGKAEGGRIGAKDGKWIQKATASIKRRKTEGKCTPITKKGCTGHAKALAKTFKKMAKKRKAA